MILLALKMLIGNRASFIGVTFGIFLTTLLISQQSAIFLGLISRAYRIVTDIPSPNIWIMDPVTESEDRLRQMPKGYLDIVRSTPGIEWAVPISITHLPVITRTGIFEIGALYGIDDATLIGAPTEMVEGQIEDLHRKGGIIVDIYSANGALAQKLPDGTKIPLKVGDELEINGRRAVVVGLSKITRGFYPQPIIFTALSDFLTFTSSRENFIGLIAAKTMPGVNIQSTLDIINSRKGLNALTNAQFKDRIVSSFLKTGILINFGLSVALGVIIGFAIAGQIFYRMTVENLKYYALIKAVGGGRLMILSMITLQALLVGIIGFSLGVGATILWGMAIKNTTLAFMFPWQLLLFTGLIVLTICLSTAFLSIRKVFRVDPQVLMGN
jgi:putative ABC transport system permease protein